MAIAAPDPSPGVRASGFFTALVVNLMRVDNFGLTALGKLL